MRSLQLEKPHAIVVIGIQGSGKTFFAEKFADTFSAPFIEQALFDKIAVDQSASDTVMRAMLDELTKTQRSLIIELALATRSERNELVKLLRTKGYIPLFVWVQVDSETAHARTRKHTNIGAAEYSEQMGRFAAPTQTEKALVISGKHTFATQAKAVLRKLSPPRTQQASNERPPSAPQRGQIIVR